MVVKLLQLWKDIQGGEVNSWPNHFSTRWTLGAFTCKCTHATSPTFPGPLLQEAPMSSQAGEQETVDISPKPALLQGEEQRALGPEEGAAHSNAGGQTD